MKKVNVENMNINVISATFTKVNKNNFPSHQAKMFWNLQFLNETPFFNFGMTT